jgi:hypothetical protein
MKVYKYLAKEMSHWMGVDYYQKKGCFQSLLTLCSQVIEHPLGLLIGSMMVHILVLIFANFDEFCSML